MSEPKSFPNLADPKVQTATNAELLAAYEAGIGQIARTVAGMTAEQMLAAPVPGRWSTHQVVIHLADAESAFAHRIKRIVAEENPTFTAWSENDFIKRLAYEAQSAADAMAQIDIERRQIGRVLKAVGVDALNRPGVHAQRGPQTARVVMEYAVMHLSHHLKFVEDKKAKLGL